MARILYEVGTEEKHTIEATYSYFTLILKVLVDGKEIISTYLRGSIRNRNWYRFSVGDREKHDIGLVVSLSFTLKFKLYVDGKLASPA